MHLKADGPDARSLQRVPAFPNRGARQVPERTSAWGQNQHVGVRQAERQDLAVILGTLGQTKISRLPFRQSRPAD